MNQPSNVPGAAVIDANICISISAKELPTSLNVQAVLSHYSSLDYDFFAPGVVVSETLYVLCGKLQDGSLTTAEHARAVHVFHALMKRLLPPPNGEHSLIMRAESIRGTYSCRRSSGAIYIALAEELAQTRQTVLLTFD